MKNKLFKVLAITLSVLPAMASAQTTFGTTGRWVDRIGDLIQNLIPIVIAIALLVFFWGLVRFISKAGDETEVKKSKGLMVWGLVALFVMITVWGLVRFMQRELNISGTQVDLPQIPRP